MTQPTVIIYLVKPPDTTGSGAQLRFYSNIRAYRDIGIQVHVALVQNEGPPISFSIPGMEDVTCECFTVRPAQPSTLAKLEVRLAWPGSRSCRSMYPLQAAVEQAYAVLNLRFPNAFHHFEGEAVGSILAGPHRPRCILSHHDLFAQMELSMMKIQSELSGQPLSAGQWRVFKFHSAAERKMARRSAVVLCISEHDWGVLRNEWGVAHAEFLPMSISTEDVIATPGRWPDRPLTLLHTGRLGHLSSYRSLQYLLARLMPALSEDLLQKLRIRIAGSFDRNDTRCQHLFALAEPYRNSIEFLDFVADLNEEYRRCDAQLVVSTDASGLRTRMIESFCLGLPVIATPIAARGIAGLESRKNFFPVQSPDEFSGLLARLVKDRRELPEVAANARQTYLEFHSRTQVAKQLRAALGRHLKF